MLADAICNWKLTSFPALDGVTITCKLMSRYWREFFNAMAESWKNLKTSNVFSSFIVC